VISSGLFYTNINALFNPEKNDQVSQQSVLKLTWKSFSSRLCSYLCQYMPSAKLIGTSASITTVEQMFVIAYEVFC